MKKIRHIRNKIHSLHYNGLIALIAFLCVSFFSDLSAQIYVVEGTRLTISSTNTLSTDKIHVISKKGKKKIHIHVAEGVKITGKFTCNSLCEIVYSDISKTGTKKRNTKNAAKVKKEIVKDSAKIYAPKKNSSKKENIAAKNAAEKLISSNAKKGLTIASSNNNEEQNNLGISVQTTPISFSRKEKTYNSHIESYTAYFYSSLSLRGPPAL